MEFFVDKTESGNDVVITYKTRPHYVFIALMVFFLIPVVVPQSLGITMPVYVFGAANMLGFVGLVIWRWIVLRPLNAKMKKALEEDKFSTSGHHLSLDNPFTIRIPKRFFGE